MTGAVASDVALVWSNCRAFNAEGSPIVQMAADAQAAFEAQWAKEGLPPLASLAGRGARRGAMLDSSADPGHSEQAPGTGAS